MRVAVVNLTAGGLSGGYVKYLRELVPRLATRSGVSEIMLFLPQAAARHAPHGFPAYGWHSGAGRSWYRELKHEIEKFGPDVVFVPTARWIAAQAPVVCMVRNMEPLARPIGGNSPGEIVRNAGRAGAALLACIRADRVIAVSNYVSGFLARRFLIPREKIGVVPHGVSSPIASRMPIGLADLSPQTRFVFTSGSIRPARGLEDVLDAFAGSERLRSCELVVAGGGAGDDPRYRDEMHRRAALTGVRARWVGQLDEAEMAWCYARCAAFAMTSRVEACPNTALEAMAAGALIASSTSDPLPEFFADAALYYPRGRSPMLALALEELLSLSDVKRAALSKQALERAGRYTWDSTADATISELRIAIHAARTVRSWSPQDP